MKNWRLHISVLFVCLSTQLLHGQKDAAYIKLYNYLPLFDAPELLGVEERSDRSFITLSSIALAYQWAYRDSSYRELELSRVSRTLREEQNALVETVTFALGYEAGKVVRGLKRPIKIRIGGSGRLYHGYRIIDTQYSSTLQRTFGFILSFTTHLDWRVRKKLYFDLAPVVQLANGSFLLENTDDPVLTFEESSAVDFHFQAPRLLLRLGVSYRL